MKPAVRHVTSVTDPLVFTATFPVCVTLSFLVVPITWAKMLVVVVVSVPCSIVKRSRSFPDPLDPARGCVEEPTVPVDPGIM